MISDKNRKGQITIFIIAGILIISIIALFLLFRKGVVPGIPGTDVGENPESFLESCIKDKITENIKTIASNGGYMENELHLNLDNEKISFLCYTDNYYTPCINQEPMLIQHLKEEIKDAVKNDVRSCFDKMAENYDKKGYSVSARYRDFEVNLIPKKAVIDIDAELTLTKSGETNSKKNFRVIVPSMIYDLAVVSQEIVSQEAKYCNFESAGFMILYPEFNINRFKTSDLNIIYTVTHKKTGDKFKFAVRGCVMPPGF